LTVKNDKGHLIFNDDGLDIKVNNLSITGGLGGTNLLLKTN
jgi:hypothetical protein